METVKIDVFKAMSERKIVMYRTEDAIIAINTIIYKLQQLAVIPNSIYDNTSILKYGIMK